MIYIETGAADICWNLAVEYYFTVEKDIGEDTIFLFWRTEPALIIGRYQNALEEIDLQYAREHGVKIVRRLSGGGTIYADKGNWMYTFITKGDADGICFRKYSQPIVDGVRSMGVDAGFNGRNDLVIGGRKFSGNAQYHLAGNTVHHGTLMFSCDVEQMVRCTTVDAQKILSKSIKSVRDRVTNVSEHLPEKMDAETFKERIVDYVMQGCRREYELTDEDRRRIHQIAKEKFDNWEAVFGGTPKFSIERSARLSGGRMTFSLEVRKGRILSCSVSGDFFADVDSVAFDEALRGCLYRRNDVCEALEKAGLDGAVYRVSAADMAELIVQE